jgi:1L-myo-inositol 1-phosphate cytidylyltransferase / CDP-L-myo-inositol myo-inositolphosphotransferase
MTMIGLLSLSQPRADLPALPRAELLAGGISLLERHVRQLKILGATRVMIVGEFADAATHSTLSSIIIRLAELGDIETLASPLDLVSLLEDDDTVILIEDGTLIDQRILKKLSAEPTQNTVLIWPIATPEAEKSVQLGPDMTFAGALRCQGRIVRKIARGLGDWDLEQTLVRAVIAEPDCETLDLSETHNTVWNLLRAQTDVQPALTALMSAQPKKSGDFIERFLHIPLASLIIKPLMATSLKPDYFSILRILFGIGAGITFFAGWLWTGLLLILITGPFTALATLMADVRLDRHYLEGILKRSDIFLVMFWVSSLAFHFHKTQGAQPPLLLAIITICFLIAHILQQKFYRDLTDLDFTTKNNHMLSLALPGRNIIFWGLFTFALFNSWYAGFVAISFYCLVLFFVFQHQIFKALKDDLHQ